VDFDCLFVKLTFGTGRTAAACLPSAILLQRFPQWLDVACGGTYPRGAMPEFRIDDLNPEQLRAATAGEGPVLTIAGAGYPAGFRNFIPKHAFTAIVD
jgi:hypothetical protein